MSHESVEPGRAVVYTLPSRFSDVLRTREFSQFFREYEGAPFLVRTLDGWSWSSSLLRIPQLIATFRTRDALDAVVNDASESTLGRLFLEGALEVDGNILVLLSVAQYTLRHSDGLSPNLIQTIARLSRHFSRKLIPIHRISGKQDWHYAPCPLDLPVSFFEPWLGSILAHSCSTFSKDDEEFESAQRTALERACGWLDLDHGDRLLDVGCGWGSLLMHAAEHHRAYATGIASSRLQAAAASERIRRTGLGARCSIGHSGLFRNSSRLPEFDKIAHLGIFEQVGAPSLPDYLRHLKRLLAPGGLVLLHRLTSSPEAAVCITLLPSDFLSDGISRELQLAERAGFELVRFESLQHDYEQTLGIWIDRLLRARPGESTRLFSTGYRAWMLYLTEIATCLNAGELQVHRVLLRRRA
jgi:cyclopropane-fatty-acyl-phospholipid synthase